MTTWLCVTASETADHLNGPYHGHVGDIVEAGRNDDIYFYHVDSCMAVALYGSNPDGHSVIVSMHLVMIMDVGPVTWFGAAEAASRYATVAQGRLGRHRFTHAAFVGDRGDWEEPARRLAASLGLPAGRSRFYPIGTSDVWAFESGQILVHRWAGKPCHWYDDASKPVGAQGGHVLNGQGGFVL